MAEVVLKNSLNSEQQSMVYNNLRHILKTGIDIFSVFGVQKVLKMGEEKLKQIMNVEKAKVLLCDYAE
jgi:hypothetical protein